MSRAFQRSPICCHCTGMRKIMHIGALCSHGTKNNQHNSSTQPRTQPCTMSDGDICSDDEKYGGFGAVMATLLRRRDRTAPARAVAAVAAAPAPGTKKSPLVNVSERTGLTKRPYKRQNKSNVPVPAPQAAAPAAAPAPIPLVTVDNAVASAPVEKKSPPHPSCRTHCGACALFIWRAHPSERYCHPDRRNPDELSGPLMRGARDLRQGVDRGRSGAPT